MKRISVVLPCYNEAESLPLYFKAVDPVIHDIPNYAFDFVLVNDGSKDKTWEAMEQLYAERNDVTLVNLSRNYGQNPALSAGLATAEGDYVILMDADLQDPVTLLSQIAEKFSDGYDVVSPHRISRKEDSWVKRNTAKMYYHFVNKIEHKTINPENVNAFRGLSRRAVNAINALPEKDRMIINEIPLVGFRSCTIDFARAARSAGKTKYGSFDKLLTYSFDSFSSGTSRPLYLPIKIGFISSCLFGAAFLALLICYLCGIGGVLTPYPEFTVFLIIASVFLGVSLILFFLGLMSLYLHNILINTRSRPTYLIDNIKYPSDKKTK